MSWFNRKKDKKVEERGIVYDFLSPALQFNCTSGYKTNKAMQLSAVYRCVQLISDSIAQLPIEPYLIDSNGFKVKYITHPTYNLLKSEPNPRMTRFTFIKTLVTAMLLQGNAFALIQRDPRGNAIALYYIPSEYVTINKPINYFDCPTYEVTGVGRVESCNMLHFLNHTHDGIEGISTLLFAHQTLGLAMDSENHASGFFRGGGNLSGILKSSTNLSPQQKKDLKSSWQQAFNPTTGNPNGIAVLEGNLDYTPIQVSPADSQLLETRQYSVIDICRFFGVSPVKAFDLSKSSYSTVEATNLSFLTETLSPLLEKIELEFERKLYKPSEKDRIDVRFDTESLLRTNKESQANYYQKLFNIGVVSPNDIRRQLDMPAMEGGDNTFVQCNIQTLEKAVSDEPANTNTIKENQNQNE